MRGPGVEGTAAGTGEHVVSGSVPGEPVFHEAPGRKALSCERPGPAGFVLGLEDAWPRTHRREAARLEVGVASPCTLVRLGLLSS